MNLLHSLLLGMTLVSICTQSRKKKKDTVYIYVTVCKKDFEDYRIGIVSGIRGQPVKILEESFSSEEACEHAIFLKRVVELLERYAE